MKSIEHRTDKIYMFASTNIALVAGIIFIFHYRNSDGACLLSASNPHCICFQVLLCLIYHKTYIKQCQVTAIIAVMKYVSVGDLTSQLYTE